MEISVSTFARTLEFLPKLPNFDVFELTKTLRWRDHRYNRIIPYNLFRVGFTHSYAVGVLQPQISQQPLDFSSSNKLHYEGQETGIVLH